MLQITVGETLPPPCEKCPCCALGATPVQFCPFLGFPLSLSCLTHSLLFYFHYCDLDLLMVSKPVWLPGGSNCSPFRNINSGLAAGTVLSKQLVTVHARALLSLHETPSMLQAQNSKTICFWYLGFFPLGFVNRKEISPRPLAFTGKKFIHTI
jgi:hypothetical protein